MEEIEIKPDIRTFPITDKWDNISFTYKPKIISSLCYVPDRVPIEVQLTIFYKPNKLELDFVTFDDWLSDQIQPKSFSISSLGVYIFDTLEILLEPLFLYVALEIKTKLHSPVLFEIQTKGENNGKEKNNRL